MVRAIHVSIDVTCLCGAADLIVLTSLVARATCAHCGRVYGLRRLAFDASPDPTTADVHVSVGYSVPARLDMPIVTTGVM